MEHTVKARTPSQITRKRTRVREGDLKGAGEGEVGGKRVKNWVLRRGKKEGRMAKKKNKVKEVNCVFLLLIGPVGHAGGYHSEISHLTLWYCSYQMSSGWHKQNKQDWSPFRSGQIPPAITLHAPLHRHELFPFFYLVPALFLSPNIHLSSARFLIFLTEAASSRLSHHQIISPSACFTVFVSLFLSLRFGRLYWRVKRQLDE